MRMSCFLPFMTFIHISQLQGSINDCSCTVDTVDHFNNMKIFPRLQSLLIKDFFRFYKVNLRQECPFWADDSKCAMRFCHVQSCEDKDIPEGLKGQPDQPESPAQKVSISLRLIQSFRLTPFIMRSRTKHLIIS